LRRSADLLPRSLAAQPVIRRRALLSGGYVREDGAAPGRARPLARVPTARTAGRVGGAGERIFRITCQLQNMSFSDSWICRGPLACPLTMPKLVESTLVAGALNCTRLKALKNSARNCATSFPPFRT